MKTINRLVTIMMVISLSMCLVGCNDKKVTNNIENKLNIVTTLFPYYDITRAVIGQVKGIGLEMAVTPGQDSHSFEPTPAEIIKMEEADLFIYNGGELETWVDTVLGSFENNNQIQVEMLEAAQGIELICAEEHEDHHHEEHEHSHSEVDPHIWTSPANAIIITEVICESLCKAMPEAAEIFKQNADVYITQLENIDSEIRSIVDNSNAKELVFADQFPLIYFADEYGLEYHSAFQGCGHDMEPSVQDICQLIDIVKEENIKAVFHLELSSQKVADAICEDTGAIKLQFNSCHNVSQKQFDEGVTYVELMEENVEALQIAME